MEPNQEMLITGICIVSDPSRCPPNYTLIDKTFDRLENADLWKDGFLGRRGMRYLCVQRQIPSQSQDVLVDVALIVEKDPPPPGFSVIEVTHDTREKATQKKCLCVRWMGPSMTNDAITELIFLSRTQKRPPTGYTMIGELNNLPMCYKMGPVPKLPGSGQTVPGYPAPVQPYNLTPLNSGLPYAISPVKPVRPVSAGQTTLTRTGPPEQSANSLAIGHVNPISGIEWKMNPKYKQLLELQNITIPEIESKTYADIERQYAYDFSVERSVSRNPRLS